MKANGVPEKLVSLLLCSYQYLTSRTTHTSQMSDILEVKTGVCQGCLLSSFLFLTGIDRIMKITTASRDSGLSWTH